MAPNNTHRPSETFDLLAFVRVHFEHSGSVIEQGGMGITLSEVTLSEISAVQFRHAETDSFVVFLSLPKIEFARNA